MHLCSNNSPMEPLLMLIWYIHSFYEPKSRIRYNFQFAHLLVKLSVTATQSVKQWFLSKFRILYMSIIIALHVKSTFPKWTQWYSYRWGGHEERSMVLRLQTELLRGRQMHMKMGKGGHYLKNVVFMNRTWTMSKVQMDSYLQWYQNFLHSTGSPDTQT
jgi:hypothetical protein